MAIYNIHEAKTQLSKLIALVEKGQDVIIARNGSPVAKLSSFDDALPEPRIFGQFNGLVSSAELEAVFAPETEADIAALFESAAAKPLKSLPPARGKMPAAG
jgi:prevent-host-death family protein